MSVKTDHPEFIQPEHANIKIWRYVALDKLLSMFNTQSIFLSRVDLLSDPFEGSSTIANACLRQEIYKHKIPESAIKQLSEIYSTCESGLMSIAGTYPNMNQILCGNNMRELVMRLLYKVHIRD